MAEDSTRPLGTPEIMTKQEETKQRRYSTGKPSSSNSGEKALPHYMRNSTGSCHDFCKYGRKHASEGKPIPPWRKKIIKKLPDDKSKAESLELLQMNKTSVVQLMPSTNSKKCTHDNNSEIIKREMHKKSPDDTSDVLKQHLLIESPDGQNPGENKAMSKKKKKKLSSAPKLKPSPVLETQPSDKHKLRKQTVYSLAKTVEITSTRASSSVKEGNLTATRVAPLKPKSTMERPKYSCSASGGSSVTRENGVKMEKKIGTSKVALRKIQETIRASLPQNLSLKQAKNVNTRKHRLSEIASSAPKNQKSKDDQKQKSNDELSNDEPKQPHGDPVQEKTLYIVETETESKVLESDQIDTCVVDLSQAPSSPPSTQKEDDDQEESDYSVNNEEDDEWISGSNETESAEATKILEGENKSRQQKDNESRGGKLNFRRGKVVDVQSDNNGPRKLKFRRGRVLGENQRRNADGRRNFKTRGAEGETDDGDPGAEKVVLRHQDQQGKKDAQGLFNNVIEETASKLVETRKSKVKALVGAFETVISLQETNPSGNSAT